MAFSENTKTEIQIRKFKAKTILLFFIVITITVGVVSFIITRKSSNEMQNKVVNLVAQGNRQQINNEKSIGKNAVDVIADVTMGYDNYQLIGDENLVVQGQCENNWRVLL